MGVGTILRNGNKGIIVLGYYKYGRCVVCMESQNPLGGGIGASIVEFGGNGIGTKGGGCKW